MRIPIVILGIIAIELLRSEVSLLRTIFIRMDHLLIAEFLVYEVKGVLFGVNCFVVFVSIHGLSHSWRVVSLLIHLLLNEHFKNIFAFGCYKYKYYNSNSKK